MEQHEIEKILLNLVRVGTVTDIDAGNLRARVIFKDRDDLPSGWLKVIQHYDADLYIEPDAQHEHSSSCGGTSTEPNHDHTRSNVTFWMPKVNDSVLVLYIAVHNADGFILGGIM